MSLSPSQLAPPVARTLNLSERAVLAALDLLAEKATIPFIARYRKEATSGLSEVELRAIEAEAKTLGELSDRRNSIAQAIDKLGKLTPELQKRLSACSTKAELEDLYAPYKTKRKTRAEAARERGLAPLAERVLQQPRDGNPVAEARAYVSEKRGVASVDEALAGARDIVAEAVAERSDVRALCRDAFRARAVLRSTAVKKVAAQGPTKFEQYYDFRQRLADVPSHRFLAMQRGQQEGVLRVKVQLEQPEALLRRLLQLAGHRGGSAYGKQFELSVTDAYERLLSKSMETERLSALREAAEGTAIEVFADNLQHLLLSAPLGGKVVLGIDPGFRTGCKCAVVDATGQLLEHATIYPTSGAQKEREAEATLVALIKRHRPAAIAVGNGTAGRETQAFARAALKRAPESEAFVVSVSESGASVYSASEVARREFPELDLTIRGAISIARRLQDPLSELVKVDPQAIGVGQYQHDVSEAGLRQRLGQVVESCVNHVGVELNTASPELLAHVAGVGEALSRAIVAHRSAQGPFRTRKELLKVAKLGPKTFEQAAGFLRIRDSQDPLDNSAVHPERYAVVQRMAKDLGLPVRELVGNSSQIDRLDLTRYVDEGASLGLPTLQDIVAELKKPGRDPRERFEPPAFRDDVQTMEDLREGMALPGVVTNVTAFGAFVDIGVHQDGLVHISELADRFIKDPAEVVKVGDNLSVRVLGVDLKRKRISLSARKR